MSKKIAVILCGSGVYDGSEIQEATLSLLYLDQLGVNVQCFAPDINHMHTINHLSGDDSNETRNVLTESARIARGNIKNLNELNVADVDAVVIPGGFGVAKNLCDFAVKGKDCTVIPKIKTIISDCQSQSKPLAVLCIAPALAARCIPGVKLTIGNDPDTAANLEAMGAKHINASVEEIVVDEEKLVISTPAYMLAKSISQAAIGIEKCINKVVAFI